MKKLILFALTAICGLISYAQTTEVVLTVNWPSWSSENKVELYSPSGVLLQTIDNGYDGVTNNSYNETTTAVSYPVNSSTTSGYYVVLYDFYGDDWNGGGNLTITADGQTAFYFNGDFNPNSTSNPIEVTQTSYFALEQPAPPPTPVPEASQFDTSGNEYIEYIPGTIPIIISAPHGGVKLSGQTIGGIFYPDNDSALPDRNCGVNERDDNTEILIREIQQSVYDQTGCYPYIIINNLHRSKLDPNRASAEATCGDSDALFYWNAYHNFIDQASTDVVNTFGKGLYIDLHGQSHSIPRIEAGYNISASNLNNTTANHLNTVSNSTITNLVSNNLGGLNQEQLVRGVTSLGGLFRTTGGAFYNDQGYSGCGVTSGYRTLPSDFNGGSQACDDTKPYNNAYFDGDYYSNRRHGSGPAASDGLGGGGTIDGIMTEVNRRVRDLGTYNGNTYDTRPQTLVPFADDYATVIVNYIDIHYNDFAEFNYSDMAYNTTDPDPTPVMVNNSSGTFSSTTGLVIDSVTGTIDTSASTPGNYVVTFQVGNCDAYMATRNIEIIDNTLGLDTYSNIKFKLFPNPTDNEITFQSNKNISMVKVYNLLGQEMLKINPLAKNAYINLSKLASGSYIITFYINEKIVTTKRVIKN
ncbi:T9SS type A sorting domain-containing protein [Lacinutrix sp. MedPE-SW]|uniref:T9SS type A sorting domain-containing protein n=1 Tax=Lacinutrix sp. MedPE-SW TaxID=1860087 RepID=UPI000920E971|nr:T9SS type A sorting domain-containing protein [Lacinutrix sp. MedPE-SW]OIQ21887.1 MAG: hypothetical protein BM549_08085 [Lacinutrix sp. MedPE-SW]